jgi:hypothetical protein
MRRTIVAIAIRLSDRLWSSLTLDVLDGSGEDASEGKKGEQVRELHSSGCLRAEVTNACPSLGVLTFSTTL